MSLLSRACAGLIVGAALAAAPAAAQTSASDLRTGLNTMLAEHGYLAAAATGFFVGYTTGVAKKDKAAQDKAVNDLIGYAADFAAFLASANPNLPKDVVQGLVKDHVVGLKAVVDAQARGDWSGAYAHLREAAGHMQMIADPLAGAISKQFPEKFAMR